MAPVLLLTQMAPILLLTQMAPVVLQLRWHLFYCNSYGTCFTVN
jgi:hypothetical protein